MNLSIGVTRRLLKTSLLSPPSSSFPLEANLEIKSHPGTLSLSVCFRIFGALRHIPSPMTRSTPPRIRASSMLRTRPYPAHSIDSVDSPLIITGQARTISSISAGDGRYCKFPRYNPNSSLTRSTSPSLGMYGPIFNSRRIMSAISTARACAVPPAARMGPAK